MTHSIGESGCRSKALIFEAFRDFRGSYLLTWVQSRRRGSGGFADLGAEEGLRIDRHRAGGPEGAVAPAGSRQSRHGGLDRRGIAAGDFCDGVGEGAEAHVAFDAVGDSIDQRGELVAGGD